ncbi:hypothetical protein MRBLMI12_000706 [Microbacterium sp. LMI12-1-1.1]|uniref:hypothetical protein n=1 Tax=Microbacterium sp. LMI12-1-1.1 TaxID=3135225 RepID=UPI00344914A7
MSDPLPPQQPGDHPPTAHPSAAPPPGEPLDPTLPHGSASASQPESPRETASTADPAEAAAPARPYTAPALDAPQYAIPAYAIPATPTSPPADAAPAQPPAQPLTHAYATPSYADPGATNTPPAVAPPWTGSPPSASAGVQPGADSGAPAAAYALPPYARHPAAPPPTYPGAPAFGRAPGGEPPGGIDTRPKALAIVALVMAGAGILFAFVGATVGSWGAGSLSPLLLFVAFVLALIALISRKQGGKGFGVAALILSIIGGILTVVLAVAALLGSFAGTSGVDSGPYGDDDYEEYVAPGITAPGTDGQPDPGAQFATPVQPTVAETAFGHDYEDVWWYAVVIDNPNADYVFDSYLDVVAYAADGSPLASVPAYTMLLSGRTAFVGYFFDMGDAQIASISVSPPQASEATLSPAAETGSFVVEQLTGPTSPDGPAAVSGTLSARFEDDQEYVAVTVLARAADGSIAAASSTYVDAVPGDGTPVPFEAWFDEVPPDATLEGFAHR